GGSVNQTLNVAAINQLGAQTLMLVADPDYRINEGGSAQENNNFANITLNVAPPPKGYVAISTPAPSQSVEPGKEVVVTGYVRATGTDAAIVGISMTIELSSGAAVIATNQSISGDQGLFVGTIIVPADTQDGSYNVVVTPTAGSITPSTQGIAIKKTVPFLNQTVPILGLPYWLFFIILAAAAEVITKFKEQVSRQRGLALSDRELQEWWRKQPTFVTFEDWLREEEEMRKMGSKPCPTCGTLNSVTATVCHKCGSLMRESPRPPGGGGSGGVAPAIQARRPGGSPPPETPSGQASPYGPSGQSGSPSGTEGIPRRV